MIKQISSCQQRILEILRSSDFSLNPECSYAEFPYLKNESRLRKCAKVEQDKVNSLEASIDGIKLENLNVYRIQSLLFNFT